MIKVLSVGNIEARTCMQNFSVAIDSTGDVKIDSLRLTHSGGYCSTGNLDIGGGEVKSQNINIVSTGYYTAENMASAEAVVAAAAQGR